MRTTRACCAAARSSRRCASTAESRSGSRSISAAWPALRSGSTCRSPIRAAFAAAATDAIAASGRDDLVLRFLWTAGREGAASPVGFALASALPAGLEELRARGLRLSVVRVVAGSARRREVDELRGEHGRAGRGPAARGADDALLVDPAGTVLEAPTANVWWREGDRLLTPTLELPILAGITRAVLVELAPAAGYEVEEGVFRARAARRRRRGLPQLVGARGDAGDVRSTALRSPEALPARPPRLCSARCGPPRATLSCHERREGPARRHGPPQRRARARPDGVGLRDPP